MFFKTLLDVQPLLEIIFRDETKANSLNLPIDEVPSASRRVHQTGL